MLLDTMDRQQQIEAAARIVARYLRLGHPVEPLVATLARALLREDAGFHAYQMLEAGIRQFEEWHGAARKKVTISSSRQCASSPRTRRPSGLSSRPQV